MTAQPDHATEAAELLACDRADAATALLAIHEQLAAIAQRLPRPVVVSEPEVTIRGGRLTTSVADEIRAQVANLHRPASPDQEGDQ